MKKYIISVAIFTCALVSSAQTTNANDSITINRIELANIIDDLMEVDAWLNKNQEMCNYIDEEMSEHVRKHTQGLLIEAIGRLHGEFQEQSLTN